MNRILSSLTVRLSTALSLLLSLSCLTSCAQRQSADTATTQSTQDIKDIVMKDNKVLVAYFSRTGENYAVGNITKGNTHIVAEMIATATGGDLFEIAPTRQYPEGYNECVKIAKQEKESKARPAIKQDTDTEGYDVVFIGYPNWWGDMPMPVYTFIEKHDWHGKTVIPFCTHEGSGLSDTEQYIAQACKGANVLKGLAIKGSVAQNNKDQARKAVANWLGGK